MRRLFAILKIGSEFWCFIMIKAAIVFLWLGAVLDPVGQMFGFRYLSIAMSFMSILWLVCMGGVQTIDKSYRSLLVLFIAILLPLHGLLIYTFRAGGGDFIDTSYIAAGLLMIFSLIYRGKDDCIFGLKAFLLSTRILSILIVFAYVSPFVIDNEWVSFFTERSVALISFREYSGLQLPYIYFLASPLLILLVAHDFSKARRYSSWVMYVVFVFSSFSLLLTGTRAHMIIAIFFIPLYFLLTSGVKSIFKGLVLLIMFVLMGLVFEEGKVLVGSFFSSSETSNSMKISLLDGYSEIFSRPENLIFGQGFNAHEWSPELRGMIAMEDHASKTELTYLELIRVFGLFVATAFILMLLFFVRATKRLSDEFEWIYPGLVIYLANAAINPYLFSVNGMLPLGLFSAIVLYFGSVNLEVSNNGI